MGLIIKMRTINVSVDDTLFTFDKLTTENYSSIFDVDTFAYFKDLHQKYGIVVSFYLFYKNESGFTLADVTDKFRDEFIANSSWMRFGVHSPNKGNAFSTGDVGMAEFNAIYSQLVRIVGKESVDFCFRPHFFKFDTELLHELRKLNLIKGIHCPDDDRPCYGLNDYERGDLFDKGYHIKDDIIFIKSQKRVEKLEIEELDKFIENSKNLDIVSIFTHEVHLTKENVRFCLEEICKKFSGRNYQWAFPMELF